MTQPNTLDGVHSFDYFGDTRDYWWNDDFIELMAKRWQTQSIQHVLDVGCGFGHWGRVLKPILPSLVRMIGVDPEEQSLKEAAKRAESKGWSDKMVYRLGQAEKLPFHDNEFDMVTCQTVLIHLPDPLAGIVEMLRVLKPGGLLVLAEPNNLASSMAFEDLWLGPDEANVNDVTELLKAHILCERGKRRLGEGDNSLGERLPGLLKQAGANHIQVYLSDKAWSMVPPYEQPYEKASVAESEEFIGRDIWLWRKDTTKRYYEAGGGDMTVFESLWSKGVQQRQRSLQMMKEKRLTLAGGNVCFLFSARK